MSPPAFEGIKGRLNIRWLGRVTYQDALALQQKLFKSGISKSADPKSGSGENYLLLLEHPPVYTFGVRGDKSHLLVEPEELAAMGAQQFWVDRGGDVTFHGPGQLVGYPILNLASDKAGLTSTHRYIRELEDLLIEVLTQLGIAGAGRREKFPGVWIQNPTQNPDGAQPQKIASVGTKLSRGRTMHGFGLNVSTNLKWFEHIMPCGIPDISMTSISQTLQRQSEISQSEISQSEMGQAGMGQVDVSESEIKQVEVSQVADLIADVATQRWGKNSSYARLSNARARRINFNSPQSDPPNHLEINERKPEWLRAPVNYTANHSRLKKTLRDLPTVCEEAGCPNLFECWSEGTATFMINGDRCTRNCGFCLVDTQKPQFAPDVTEPDRLAEAVKTMGLNHVVITAVARDDLADGGVGGFVNTIRAVRRESPDVSVEVLIPDFKGQPDLLSQIFAERPEVLNHNLETVLRLQKLVRPQAGYARSLSVIARAKEAGLTTKSSLMVGLGETMEEVKEALLDLSEAGTDIVTIGQYLRPSQDHLPMSRWYYPAEFEELADMSQTLGIGHIEAGPLVRSSYKAGKVRSALAGASISQELVKG